MSLLLLESNDINKENGQDYLKCCSHVIELDFLRNESTNDSSKWQKLNSVSKNIHILGYSIKEIRNEDNDFKLYTYPNLLMLEYPEYSMESNKHQKSSDEYYKSIDSFVTVPDIPTILGDKSMIEIESHASVHDVIGIMEKNISMIQNKLGSIYKYAIYIYWYIDILNKLVSNKSFSTNEINHIMQLHDNVSFLKIAVDSDIQKNKNIIDNNKLLEIENKNKYYLELLNNIDYVDVSFINSNEDKYAENLKWLQKIDLGKCKISNHIDFYRIHNLYDSSELFNSYIFLSQYSHINLQIIMTKTRKTDNEEGSVVPHTIEINSTPWAYVFYKLYGKNATYTLEKDKLVMEILDHINKLELPPGYIL
tara:strand:+ start:694 stop:1788 length:1095 start_codon:yes stop_codon:yes gene_type:complete